MNTVLARLAGACLRRWRSRFPRFKAAHLQLGARGEKLAARYLRRQGFKVLYRHFRGRQGGEIDLVCRERDTLVFIEVKTRAREDYGRPLEAVHSSQQRRISLGALAWLRLLGNPDILFRFDVVEVTILGEKPPRIELVRNAFQLSEPYLY